MTVCSPWQWFCSSRTLSNSLETTLTIAALTSWPWQWPTETLEEEETDGIELRMSRESTYERSEVEVLTQCVFLSTSLEYKSNSQCRLRQCLLLAALACVLRPTNLLVWICVASSSLVRAKNNIRMVLIRETILCGYNQASRAYWWR